MFSAVLIGLFFGFLLQKTQFCFVSGFRDIFIKKQVRFLSALFLAISIQSIGFFVLNYYEMISIPQDNLPLLATIVGGLLFGFGIIASGFCASGAWFRSGEGNISAILVLLVFCLTVATCSSGALKWKIQALTNSSIYTGNLYNYLQISPIYLILFLIFITILLIGISLRQKRFYSKSALNTYAGATLIGLLGVVAWGFSSIYGREYGYGVAVPSANTVQYLVTGQMRYLNWGTYFVISIVFGSFLSAILSKEFKLNLSDSKIVPRQIFGAICMGIGASLAKGCTITNALVATAYFSTQGWLALIMIILGCFLANLIFKPTICKL